MKKKFMVKQGKLHFHWQRIKRVKFSGQVLCKNTNIHSHCVKSVQIRSFFWSVFSCIWTEYGDLLRTSVHVQCGNFKLIFSLEKQQIWTLSIIMLKMAKHTFNILRCKYYKILKHVCPCFNIMHERVRFSEWELLFLFFASEYTKKNWAHLSWAQYTHK